ncbi:glycosyltransferase [Dialister invisus]|uniref:glycosyltransferase n=1 Tax=Dialister invisus TaxID=218538 RepID=UPI00351FC813
MKKDWKISVIIPVYNSVPWLRRCLESVICQTLKEIQVICIDDGSTDESPRILAEYEQKDNRIFVITQKNEGPSSARNRGLEMAEGKYIYFLDSDDWIEHFCLEKAYTMAEANALDICLFDGQIFFGEDVEHHEHLDMYKRKADDGCIYTGIEMMERLVERNEYTPVVWLNLFKRELIAGNRISFYEGIIHEDNLFTLLCFGYAERVKYLPAEVYHRQVRNGSIMQNPKSADNVKGYFISFLELQKVMIEKHWAPDVLIYQGQEFLYNTIRIYSELSEYEQERVFLLLPQQNKLLKFFLGEYSVFMGAFRKINKMEIFNRNLETKVKKLNNGLIQREMMISSLQDKNIKLQNGLIQRQKEIGWLQRDLKLKDHKAD